MTKVTDLEEVDGAYLPERQRFAERWRWAREGRGSSAVDILDYGDYVYYHTSLRAPGDRPPEPGSFSEDATASHVFETLTSMVTAQLRTGEFELITLTDRSAALRRISGVAHKEPEDAATASS